MGFGPLHSTIVVKMGIRLWAFCPIHNMNKRKGILDMKALVIGFARSGAAAAHLLNTEGAEVVVSDPKLDLSDPRVTELTEAGVVFTTEQDESLLEDVDVVVKNPGIPYHIPILKAAKAREIPIEVEVTRAQAYIKGTWVALTGSNGKTTATKMVARVLEADADTEHPVKVAGNIGTPVSELAPDLTENDTLITELSSFQLMAMPNAQPDIAVITNIFASHLDFHGSREAYIAAKLNITMHQKANQYLVMNYDRPEWAVMVQETKATIVPFSRLGMTKAGAYQEDGALYFQGEFIMNADEIGVPGDHNIENALIAIAVGKIRHVANEKIVHALQTFGGVEHRLQNVGVFNGRKVFNDSKATDIEATESALSGFDGNVVLLAGGLDRGDDLTRLIPAMKGKVKQLIIFGETAPKLLEVAKEMNLPVIETENVKTAVPLAFENSSEGDVILLSPAAASWDQYKSFEVRGDMFMDAVKEYAK